MMGIKKSLKTFKDRIKSRGSTGGADDVPVPELQSVASVDQSRTNDPTSQIHLASSASPDVPTSDPPLSPAKPAVVPGANLPSPEPKAALLSAANTTDTVAKPAAVVSAEKATAADHKTATAFGSATAQSQPATTAAAATVTPVVPVTANLPPAKLTITLKHIWYSWLAFSAFMLLLGLAWERPSIWEFLLSALFSIPVGLLYAYLYRRNQIRKQESSNLLRINPGIKGLNYLLGSVPTWISFKEKEKAEVLNSVIHEMWPYINKAVANTVRASVEPLLESFKPGFVSKIYFKDFTFGGAPIELDNIWVDPAAKDKVVMEVDVRWSAETANIALAVDMAAGGNLTRLVVRVMDLAVSATARITFQPLVDEYPGFGAMTVALMGIPILRYRANFGKLGGSTVATAVRAWLDNVIRQQLLGMLVWPQRLVVPIFDEKVTGPLDKLLLRNVGVLKVMVKQGWDLAKKDKFSENDAFVVAYTNPKFHEKTRVINNSKNPQWNQELWFLIQEPDTQCLYVECFDHDDINFTEMAKLGFLRNLGNLGTEEFIGRCKLPLQEICAQPGSSQVVKPALGREEFSNFEGCGHGEGFLELEITYFPLGMINVETASKGALLVNVIKANNLLPESDDDLPDPYLVLKVSDRDDELRTTAVANNTDPVWPQGTNKFEVSNVKRTDTVIVELMDSDVGKDAHVATARIKVDSLGYTLVERTWEFVLEKAGEKRKQFRKTDAPPSVTLQMQWIPFA